MTDASLVMSSAGVGGQLIDFSRSCLAVLRSWVGGGALCAEGGQGLMVRAEVWASLEGVVRSVNPD